MRGGKTKATACRPKHTSCTVKNLLVAAPGSREGFRQGMVKKMYQIKHGAPREEKPSGFINNLAFQNIFSTDALINIFLITKYFSTKYSPSCFYYTYCHKFWVIRSFKWRFILYNTITYHLLKDSNQEPLVWFNSWKTNQDLYFLRLFKTLWED